MTTFRHFTDIQAWQEARALVALVYGLEIGNDRAMRDQIRRAALSVMNNIADGFARGSDAQFAHFLNIARGSAAEVESMLYLLDDISPALRPSLPAIRQRLDLTVSLIAKLTTYLRRIGEPKSSYHATIEQTSGLPDFRTSGLSPLRASGP
jgi:four helix bundle protein